MKNILITGGGGYIGSMLTTELINLGFKVTVIDLLKFDKGSLDHLYFEKNFTFIKGDVRNLNLLKKYISKNEFIIPMAALVGAPLCEKFKKDALSTNLGSIKTLCNLATQKNKVIYLKNSLTHGDGFYAWLGILFLAGFTPLPYKVFTIVSGLIGFNLPIFIFISN